MSGNRLIPLGHIGAPHGVRGQVKIRSFTADPEDITAYGPLTDKNGRVYELTITGGTPDALIATLKGITTREQAESLRNIELCVPRNALPAPKKGEYYYEDLVGLKVVTRDGTAFGTIKAVHNFGAGDLVEVTLASGDEEMYPFNSTVFPEIDVTKGIVVIEPPVVVGD